MEKTGLIVKLKDNMLDERVSYKERSISQVNTIYQKNQKDLLATLKDIGKQGDVGLILQAERNLIENELEFYGNSPPMKKSLDNALSELNGAEKTYAKIHNPNQYQKEVNEAFLSHKSRHGDLPLDETRQFLKSHNARLINMDKSRLDKQEKEVIEVRRSNLRAGEATYISLQKIALNITIT